MIQELNNVILREGIDQKANVLIYQVGSMEMKNQKKKSVKSPLFYQCQVASLEHKCEQQTIFLKLNK